MRRLHQLDYLRGTIAICIMLYHFLLWERGPHRAQSFLGRMGIYGVSTFYVLSGLTLFHVYYSKMKFDKYAIADFFKKRFLRIVPIYTLVIFLTALHKQQIPVWEDLFLNLTGLFGIFKWDKYLAVGAWSIGNEWVFYLFFPLFIYFGRKHQGLFWILGISFLMVAVYFACFYLDENRSLSSQWRYYIFPFNQIFLFFGGFALGYTFKNVNVNNTAALILVLTALMLFLVLPSGNDLISLVVGVNRILFSGVIFTCCLGFYKLDLELPKFLHILLVKIGEWSFGIYLLHPLVYRELQNIAYNTHFFSKNTTFVLAIFVTIGLSSLVYCYFEAFFIKLGKK